MAGVSGQEAASDAFAQLAAEGNWEELLDTSSARLAEVPNDVSALYWSGRAQLERGRALLVGPRFAQELGRSLLRGAAAKLGAVPPEVENCTDAPDWAFVARYLAGDDETLPADVARAAEAGSGFAARVRGWLARDRGEADAAAWFERAAAAQPDDAAVRLEWVAELAALGQRDKALAVLEEARALGADRNTWLEKLLTTLPGPENASEFLRRLQPLLEEPGAERNAPLAVYHAWGLEESGRTAEAEAVLARATEDRRPDIDRHHAQVLLLLKRPADAAAILAPLAEAGDTEALELLVSAADAESQVFEWEQALATYDLALAVEPAHARAAANRALTQARSGATLDGYHALVAAYPRRADVLNDAALAEAGRGHAAEARALLERAVERPVDEPGALDSHENLAMLLLTGAVTDAARARVLLDDVLMAVPDRDRALTLRCRALRLSR